VGTMHSASQPGLLAMAEQRPGDGRWLDKSRRALGFDDPLTIRFDLHRWLSAEREEAYSDWLA
jgi:hypothetical protein